MVRRPSLTRSSAGILIIGLLQGSLRFFNPRASSSNTLYVSLQTALPRFQILTGSCVADDLIIDETSNKPGEQAFEKMIAGLYLGEIFRLVMCEMTDAGALFLGQETYKIEKAYAFDTAFLSLIERYVVSFCAIFRCLHINLQ